MWVRYGRWGRSAPSWIACCPVAVILLRGTQRLIGSLSSHRIGSPASWRGPSRAAAPRRLRTDPCPPAAAEAPSLAFPGAARVAFERDELFPLAGLDPSGAERHVAVGRLVDQLHGVEAAVARQYLDGALDFPRASAVLARDALMPSADETLKFLNRFRSY